MVKAGAFASAPLKVYASKDDSEQPNHALQQLLNRPNTWQSGYEFREAGCLSLDLTGNFFVYKWRDNGRAVRQLVPLRSDRVSLLVSAKIGLMGYKYAIGGSEQVIPREDIIHIKLGNPEELWFGFPPIQAALTKIASDNEATDFQKAILQNRAVPGVAVTTKSDITAEQLARLKATWKQGFGGGNRGATAFLSEGMDVKVISLNMQELDFSTVNDAGAKRILMAFGVPQEMVGLSSETYANAAQGRLSFYQDTIEPLWNRVDDWIDVGLIPEFGTGLYSKFDTSEVAAFELLRIAKLDSTYKGVTAGTVTVNEARASAGYPPVDGGDVFLRSMIQIETPATITVQSTRKAHGHEAKSSKADRVTALRRAAVIRRDTIEKLQPKFRAIAVKEFKSQADDVLAKVKSLYGSEQKFALDALDALEKKWTTGVQLAFQPILTESWKQAAEMGIAEIGGVDFTLANDDVIKAVNDFTFKFAQQISATSVEDVREIIVRGQAESLGYEEIISALKTKFSEWGTYRAQMVAVAETVRAASKGSAIGWHKSGVIHKEWMTTEDDLVCEECASMDGKVVEVLGAFLSEGEEVEGSGRVVTYGDVEGGDLHPFDRCTIIPVLED